jgi:hypothetical protein
MSVRFFVSYKRNDPDTQRLLPPLRKALEGFRYKVFQDVVDIDPGENWETKLSDSIESADEFLLLLSAAAAQSDRVEDEVRIANTFWKSKNKKPRIIPIYINLDTVQNPKLQRILEDTRINHLPWASEADTPIIAERIRALVDKRLRPGLIKKTSAAALAAVLIVLFLHSMLQIVQIRNARSSVADALAAFGQLRAVERLVVPRLWLAGRWKPETLAAKALDEHAAPLLGSTVRNQVDHGLLLAAQSAVLSGRNITDAAQRAYDEQHYDFLVTSIDAREEIAGRSLAVSSNGGQWRIAIGGHIWTCAEPIGHRPCVASPRISRQPVVAAAAFDSQTLRLAGYSGDVTTLNLTSGQESSPSATDATFVAADQGNVATSFDHGGPGGMSVRVDPAGPSLRSVDSGDLGRVKMLAFGPCDDCIATLGVTGVVKIWRWRSPVDARNPLVLPGKTLLLAATRSGHRLAVISSTGDLALYGADAKIVGTAPSIDLTDAESLAISPDGAHVAVIHNGNATVFDDRANFRTFIPATKQPKPIAVAFAGNDYVVTRTPAEARVWRLRSTDRRDLTPNQRWAEWRKMFGLGGAGIVTRED